MDMETIYDLVNKYYIAKYNLESAASSFRASSKKGFGAMAMYEGGERWNHAQDLVQLCEVHGSACKFMSIPEPNHDWSDLNKSMQMIYDHDADICDALYDAMEEAEGANKLVLKMCLDKMKYEKNEIHGIMKKMEEMSEEDVCSYLWHKYGEH